MFLWIISKREECLRNLVIFIPIFIIFSIQVIFFSFNLAVSPMEQYYIPSEQANNLYQEIQVLWIALFGDSILTIRCLSVISALGIFFLTSHLIYLVSKDSLISLVIPSIYIFFPSVTFAFSSALPLAFISFFSLIGFIVLLSSIGWRASLVVGGICAILPFLSVFGFCLSIALFIFSFSQPRTQIQWFILVLSFILVFGLCQYFFPISYFHNLYMNTSADLLYYFSVILRIYAFIWFLLFSGICFLLFVPSLRYIIGGSFLTNITFIYLSFFSSLICFIFISPFSRGMIEVNFTPLICLACIVIVPFSLWVKYIMPNIRSLWVWIIIPVIMYCSFWLILAPVDLLDFPFSLLK